MRNFWKEINQDFQCLHCDSYISTAELLAGVRNRNHCPYCLWSRHLDLFNTGDRLAACKALMRPVGLTLKQTRNKYASAASGELMLVHLCIDCNAISINRIASDDIPEVILEVFETSRTESAQLWKKSLKTDIKILGGASYDLIYCQLFGKAARFALEAVSSI